MLSRDWFFIGLIIGLFWGSVLTIFIYPSIESSSTLDKAIAISECKEHYGVYNIADGYINCNDTYRPKPMYSSDKEIYLLLKIVERNTYFGVTFMDWKNYKSDLNK